MTFLTKPRAGLFAGVVVGAAVVGALMAPSALAAPPGTAFSYQGVLEEGGVPVTTAVDIRFTLYSDVGGTTQVGTAQTASNVTPVDGVFSASPDFGVNAFVAHPDQQARWLRIEVSPAGAGTYDDLGLQKLQPTPFALNTRGLTVTPGGTVGVGGGSYSNVTLDVRQHPLDDFLLIAESENGTVQHMLLTDTGELGIGIDGFTPLARLHVTRQSGNSDDPVAVFEVENCGAPCAQPAWTENVRLWNSNSNGRAGIGFTIATSMTLSDVPDAYVGTGDSSDRTSLYLATNAGGALQERVKVDGATGKVGIGTGTATPATMLDVNGAVTIRGGADIVEGFDASGDEAIEPGTLMVIDPANPGRIMASSEAYDIKVAGVVSGANGVNPGIKLGQGELDGELPIAMTGRVYVKASAENGPITPGTLLTTAATPGHAMASTDRDRSHGAVIGKAMSGLDEGTGLVLVLVNLQ